MFLNFVSGSSSTNHTVELRKCLIDPGPDLLVCDEGHILKNAKTNIKKAADQVRTRRRVLLTGTPVENNLEEVFSLVSFVQAELLGSVKDFSEK